MANPSVTYTFTNGNVADASQVNQNFTDLINSLIDGSKSINIDAATIGGLLTANGNVDLGNSAGDSISMTGFIDTNVTIKSIDAGSSAGPDLIIDRDSASAADSDALGRIIFRGNDDAGTPADNDYASIEASIVDSGAGSEDGKLEIKISEAGTATSYIMVEATKGVALKGRTDGQAVAAGYVGETLGTERAGSGGKTYSVQTNTALTGSPGAVVSLTLNKGIYYVSANTYSYTSSTANLTATMRLGGSAITESRATLTNVSNPGFLSFSLPITVTADGVVVALYAETSGTGTGQNHEMWAIRIA